jgi:DNA invertase Pin-like site-specific DNA recombinase
MRKGDVLVAWKLDRLARLMKQLIETIELLDAQGVGFQSTTEAMDTTTPSGRLLFHICAALAEFERNIIRKKTVVGLASARAQGRTGAAKKKLDDAAKREVRALLAIPESTAKSVAERFGVSVARSTGKFRRLAAPPI